MKGCSWKGQERESAKAELSIIKMDGKFAGEKSKIKCYIIKAEHYIIHTHLSLAGDLQYIIVYPKHPV
jgi:hypothetical protein